MDEMEIDPLLEIPDTPDRVATRHLSEFSTANDDVDRRLNILSSRQRGRYVRNLNGRRSRDSGLCDLANGAVSQDEAELLFHRGRLARLISEDLEGKGFPWRQVASTEHVMDGVSKVDGKCSSHSSIPSVSWRKKGKEMHQESEHSVNGQNSRLLISGASVPGRSSGRLLNGIGVPSRLPVDAFVKEKADVFYGGNAQLENMIEVKGINLSSNSQDRTVQMVSNSLHPDVPQVNATQRSLADNGHIAPLNVLNRKTSNSTIIDDNKTIEFVNGGMVFSSSRISDGNVREEMGTDSHSQLKIGQTCNKWYEQDAFSQRKCQRRLVRNGCISPCNIERKNNTTKSESHEIERNAYDENSEGSSLLEINILSPNSEEVFLDKMKGKAIADDHVIASSQHVKAEAQANRMCPLALKEVNDGANSGSYAVRPEDNSCRTTCNRIAQASVFSCKESSSVLTSKDNVNIVDGRLEITVCDEHDTTQMSSDLMLGGKRSTRQQKLVKGKRKSSSTHSHGGECSGSISNDSEVLFVGSSGQHPYWKSNRTGNFQQHGSTVLTPVIEVDELDSPEVGQSYRISDDSSAKARQVESDEILARQLQEQLFNESPDFDATEEMDASIAWSLQQEEDSQLAAAFARRGQSHGRESLMTQLYAHHPQMTSRNSSAHPAIHNQVPVSSRMSRLVRSSNIPWTDLEERLEFLEELEAEFDTEFDDINEFMESDDSLDLEHEFDENDYEMLLALDDNNEDTGASHSQINSLPQSIIQSDNIGEACAICLETPSIGDTIRHLPCLHKFHKDCIDTWLRRKTSCPICKSSIT